MYNIAQLYIFIINYNIKKIRLIFASKKLVDRYYKIYWFTLYYIVNMPGSYGRSINYIYM